MLTVRVLILGDIAKYAGMQRTYIHILCESRDCLPDL